MADIAGRYPLSTAAGEAIPFDVVRPNAVLKKTFTTGASSASFTVPTGVEVMSVIANADCIIKFASSAASASLLVDGTITSDVIFIPSDILTVISPPVGKGTFAIRGDTGSGTAVVQFAESWRGTYLAPQTTRR